MEEGKETATNGIEDADPIVKQVRIALNPSVVFLNAAAVCFRFHFFILKVWKAICTCFNIPFGASI